VCGKTACTELKGGWGNGLAEHRAPDYQ
jgi:hypothetical protein